MILPNDTIIDEDLKSLNKYLFDTFGNQQLFVCVEELAELQQSISKMVRKPSNENKANLIEEIGDVLIVLNGLIEKYDICTSDIEHTMAYKIIRTNEKLNLGKK